MAIVMKGAEVSKPMKENIVNEVKRLNSAQISPTLATVRVGEKPDSVSYEKGTIKFMASLGIECKNYVYDENIDKEEFFNQLREINRDKSIHGILLFRPLPKAIECKELDYIIDPVKDIDGSNPINMGKLMFKDSSAHAPCTAEAVVRILEHFQIPLEGKEVVVLGRSLVVGKPVSMLLLDKNATVTVCHSKTADIEKVCKRADVLVAAVGRAEFANKDFIKEGAVVVDVGINVNNEGKLKGDVNYDDVLDLVSYITPVPGGVGNVTNAVLAEHVIKACIALNE